MLVFKACASFSRLRDVQESERCLVHRPLSSVSHRGRRFRRPTQAPTGVMTCRRWCMMQVGSLTDKLSLATEVIVDSLVCLLSEDRLRAWQHERQNYAHVMVRHSATNVSQCRTSSASSTASFRPQCSSYLFLVIVQELFLGAHYSNMQQQLLVLTVLMFPADYFAARHSAQHLTCAKNSFAMMCNHTSVLWTGWCEVADMPCFMVAAAAHEGDR